MQRRNSCKFDLHKYLLTYHPEAFPLSFSVDHLQLIADTQKVILDGGCVVAAFPRGSGKTTIFQRAEIWASLYGHRKFPMLLCADDLKFKQLLKGIKTVLENNELLLEDFPEVIFPIRKLERIANRANFQMQAGVPTYMRWGTEQVVFATTPNSIACGNAGVVIGGGGLTGAAVRGGVLTTPTGDQIRPDAVLIDDPQTRKSAKSESQCQERHDIVMGDIMGMAGPGKTMAAMVACTVIYRDDLADRLLDRERSPGWRVLKVPMIKSWPRNMALWEKYDSVRREELLGDEDTGAANQFYAARRVEMDEGSAVYWDERVLPGKLSALQSAMDEYLSDRRAFMAEKQNSPDEQIDGDLTRINSGDLVKRTNQYQRGKIPADATTVTCHIDVQAKLLYWMVVAWTQSAGGYIVEYGTTPRINRRHFILRDIKKSLTDHYPGQDEPGALRQAIKETVEYLSNHKWLRVDGAEMGLDRGLIDSRWQTETIEMALQASNAPQWMPCYGVGIRAKDAPIAVWTKKRGIKRGTNWVLQKPDKRLYVSCFYDTNYWKNAAYDSLTVPQTHSHAVTFYKETISHHQLLADHLTSEVATRVEARGRIVDEWDLPSNRPDNHWWDTLTANFVAASMCGIRKESISERPAGKPKPAGRRVQQLKI